VQITLKELGLQYEEVIIDLAKPRDDWYLQVNSLSHEPEPVLCLAPERMDLPFFTHRPIHPD